MTERGGQGGTQAMQRRNNSSRPNFVFILADDLGYADLHCYGGRANCSPNLDRLATHGLRFTNGYANSSVCSPSRFATIAWPSEWIRQQPFLPPPVFRRIQTPRSTGSICSAKKSNASSTGEWSTETRKRSERESGNTFRS